MTELSVLKLRFTVLDEPDAPAVSIIVDGEDPFAGVAPDWRGFDPAEILGPGSPLLPAPAGRRVAVRQCSCGIAGCGVIAPAIVAAPDGSRISWVDFRDYTGVFAGPVTDSVSDYDGRPWDLPDLHFGPEQYLAEVERAGRDRSWETARRATARLLANRLRGPSALPPGMTLRRAHPAWRAEGVEVVLTGADGRRQVLRLTSAHPGPDAAAEDMARQLRGTAPDQWSRAFAG